MTIQLMQHVDWIDWSEVDHHGRPITCVSSLALGNYYPAVVLLGGSQDPPEGSPDDWWPQSEHVTFQPILGDAQEIREFEAEYNAFKALLPTLREMYDGQYVAVHRGSVVDADQSRDALIRRFFERSGDTSVYVGYVGAIHASYQVTPFFL